MPLILYVCNVLNPGKHNQNLCNSRRNSIRFSTRIHFSVSKTIDIGRNKGDRSILRERRPTLGMETFSNQLNRTSGSSSWHSCFVFGCPELCSLAGTSCPDWPSFYSLFPPRKCDITSKKTTTASFHTLYISSLTLHEQSS
jgi:hypothetical protein